MTARLIGPYCCGKEIINCSIRYIRCGEVRDFYYNYGTAQEIHAYWFWNIYIGLHLDLRDDQVAQSQGRDIEWICDSNLVYNAKEGSGYKEPVNEYYSNGFDYEVWWGKTVYERQRRGRLVFDNIQPIYDGWIWKYVYNPETGRVESTRVQDLEHPTHVEGRLTLTLEEDVLWNHWWNAGNDAYRNILVKAGTYVAPVASTHYMASPYDELRGDVQ